MFVPNRDCSVFMATVLASASSSYRLNGSKLPAGASVTK